MWIVTCTSCLSARQQSIAAGVVPQSSCSFRPIAPAAICSARPAGMAVLPLPVKPKFSGKRIHRLQHRPEIKRRGRAGRGASADRQARAAADHRGESSGDGFVRLLRADEMDVRVEPARRKNQTSPAITSVVTPTIIPLVTPAIMSGLPALPMPEIKPSLMPMSAL